MIRLVTRPGVFEGVEAHLEKPEQVGFFLAHYDASHETFDLQASRPVVGDGYAVQTDQHVVVADETRAEMIQWAWRENLSLVEIHSHGDWAPAQFSGSDIYGFQEWVPHLWWRLRRRPYAAIVSAGDTFDAWAWTLDPQRPLQVSELETDGRSRAATHATFAALERSNRV
jgi:hypothetical protein